MAEPQRFIQHTVALQAWARYGYGGKQFIARITGRDPKFTFEREFLGRKGGKRGEDTEVDVDDPGLYETRDVDSKGRVSDAYHLIWQDTETLVWSSISKEEAMKIARDLQAHADPNKIGRAHQIKYLTEQVRVATEKMEADPASADEVLSIRHGYWQGGKFTRAEMTAARRAEIERLNEVA